MIITKQMKESIPFQYAYKVRTGEIVTGDKIKKAVERFFSWIENAGVDGYTLDHDLGLRAIRFFPMFLNHTKGKLAGRPFELAPFQQFTIYNVFGWLDSRGLRRINTVYDKRAKKNGKSAEMAGIGLWGMCFDLEMEAEIYIGATKEQQAEICWKQAAQFIQSPVANKLLEKMGFYVRQKLIGFIRTASIMRPLGGDSKTQDGINAHISIIDEYHAHKDDSVKENLESSSVQRNQPITWHITTAGVNIHSACKQYEDSVIEVLEGRKNDNHLWIMIHDVDEGDDWEDESVWIKANPLLNDGLDIDQIRKEFIKAKNQPSKIPNFKTKHLNMWVDAPQIWIPNEIWMKNKVDEIPMDVFHKFKSFAGLDLSSTTDISAYIILSEPDDDGNRFLKSWFFVPFDTMEYRSKEDRVPYKFWVDQGFMIATPGNVIDYDYIEDKIKETYHEHYVIRVEVDQWNASQVSQNLMNEGINISYFSQSIGNISFPTKQFEKLVYEGKIKHDGNPVLSWMLSGCVTFQDANDNIKVHKGNSQRHGRRIDGIVATINALGGSLSPPEETNQSIYDNPDQEIYF